MTWLLRSAAVQKGTLRRGWLTGPVGASDLGYAFDDEVLRGLDVPFLRDVDTLVEAMVAADPSLARVAPEMVARDLAA